LRVEIHLQRPTHDAAFYRIMSEVKPLMILPWRENAA